jgi:hypothetical protein
MFKWKVYELYEQEQWILVEAEDEWEAICRGLEEKRKLNISVYILHAVRANWELPFKIKHIQLDLFV